MIQTLLATLLTLMSLPAYLSTAEAQKSGCKPVASFFVDKSGPENEAIKDMVENHLTPESSKLADAMKAQILSEGCAALVIEETSLDQTAVIFVEPSSGSKSGFVANLSSYATDKTKAGCGNVAAMDQTTRLNACSNYNGTLMPGESGEIISAVHLTKGSLARVFMMGRTASLDKALKTFGLESQALKVRESLVTMSSAATGGRLVLEANGYVPKLFSTALWERRLPADTKAEKIVVSLLFLNGQGKAFVDVNMGGSKIVDLKGFQRPSSGTLMGYDLLQSLTNAMEKEGYSYTPTWTKK